MKTSSISTKNINWLLLGFGVSAFTLSLFNKKTRRWSLKLLNFGADLVAQYVRNKYFSSSYDYVKVVPNHLPMRGVKGGKSNKKRTFRKNSLKVKPTVIM